MKKKRFSAVLGCVLALSILIGLAVPLIVTADAVELTVLNPKGSIEPMDSMPLADRQPLIDKLEAGETIELLLIWYEKSNNALQSWAIGLMLQERWQAQYGATVNLTGIPSAVTMSPNNSHWYSEDGPGALRLPSVASPWGPKSGKNHIDGMPYNEMPFERYQAWAEFQGVKFDAIVFGVMD